MPSLSRAKERPATLPGIPAASGPKTLASFRTSPFSSRYMSGFAARGAFSRKSKEVALPSAPRQRRNPPPPMFPAWG